MVRAITASGIVPGGIAIGPEPNFEGIEENAVGIVWINGESLIVPVLWIVSRAARAVKKRIPGRARDLTPGYAAELVRSGTRR